ncbi:hypothetical protein [Coleofasciculus sp. E1-EBD-02]|uniref:hypothetical protein n=1 Tax=Coleofasciculus sp. E1-EBD-02 TaxID=3068481 RepID=UPI0033018080
MKEYLKHLLIHTPFEIPAQNIQFILDYRRGRKHPELDEIHSGKLNFAQFYRALHYPLQAFNFIACWD